MVKKQNMLVDFMNIGSYRQNRKKSARGKIRQNFPDWFLSETKGILTLLTDPTHLESKKTSQIQWPVPSINAELVDVFIGE